MLRIEICGGIATGKTSLAMSLAHETNVRIVREKYREVPFWEKFYNDPERYSLAKNINFLLFHIDAIQDQDSAEGIDAIVCDFALFQDLAYSALADSAEDQKIIEALYGLLLKRTHPPAAIVHLKCSPKTQLKRIAQRGRKIETRITEDFLARLNEQIEEKLTERIRSANIPILEINSDEIDFVRNQAIPNVNARLATLLGAKNT